MLSLFQTCRVGLESQSSAPLQDRKFNHLGRALLTRLARFLLQLLECLIRETEKLVMMLASQAIDNQDSNALKGKELLLDNSIAITER